MKVMDYACDRDVACFKLRTTLHLTRSGKDWSQSIESYGILHNESNYSLRIDFTQWVTFNARIRDLTPESYVVFELLDGSQRVANESDSNALHPPSDFVVCARFESKIGLNKTTPVRLEYGKTQDSLEDLLFQDVIITPWLDMMSRPKINLEKNRKVATHEKNSLLRNLDGNQECNFVLYFCFKYPISFSSLEHKHSKSMHTTNSSEEKKKEATNQLWITKPVQCNLNEDSNCQSEVMYSSLLELKSCITNPNNEQKEILSKYSAWTSLLNSITEKDKNLIWSCRHHLKKKDNKSLPIILYCVNSDDDKYIKEIEALIREWDLKGWSAEECLIFLSKTFRNQRIRNLFVELKLKRFSVEALEQILPQLVQAIAYEELGKSSLIQLLFDMSKKSFSFTNTFYWLLSVEKDAKAVFTEFQQMLLREEEKCFLEWKCPNGEIKREGFGTVIFRQRLLANFLSSLYREGSELGRCPRDKRKEVVLKGIRNFQKTDNYEILFSLPLPLPIDPSKCAIGIDIDSISVFDSNAFPILLTFNLVDGERYKTIFKNGDDLRQDLLILQIISLFDRVSKENGVNAHLTPYRVIPTSKDKGFVEFVKDSIPIANLSTESIPIQDYLRSQSQSSNENSNAIVKSASITYMRSLSSNSIVSYVLGIGDRHTDNLLLHKQGRIFHIDFGYIFGNQPQLGIGIADPTKVFSGSIKLNAFMLEGLGGTTSEMHDKFLNFSANFFTIIRKYVHAVFSLLFMMMDTGIKAFDDKQNYSRSILFVWDRFMVVEDDENAKKNIIDIIRKHENSFGGIIEDSSRAIKKYMTK